MIVSGIDAGSKVTKVIVRSDGKCIGSGVKAIKGADAGDTENELLAKILHSKKASFSNMDYVFATGLNLKHFHYVTRQINEAVALAKWASAITDKKTTILNIGYQKVHVVKCANGRLFNSITGDKCAAGAGIFLEMITDLLEVELASISELASKSSEPVQVENTCSVFAETEIISLLYQKIKPQDILAGCINGLASRIFSLLLKIRPEGEIYAVGGYTNIRALFKAIETQIGSRFIIPEDPQIAAAAGAALLAEEYASGNIRK
jgi:predicted CoA-substrate-specific enzyme activase